MAHVYACILEDAGVEYGIIIEGEKNNFPFRWQRWQEREKATLKKLKDGETRKGGWGGT